MNLSQMLYRTSLRVCWSTPQHSSRLSMTWKEKVTGLFYVVLVPPLQMPWCMCIFYPFSDSSLWLLFSAVTMTVSTTVLTTNSTVLHGLAPISLATTCARGGWRAIDVSHSASSSQGRAIWRRRRAYRGG